VNLSRLELTGIEILECILNRNKLFWNATFWDFLERPVTACENLNLEVDLGFGHSGVARGGFKITIQLLRFDHVFEHSLDFVHSIVSTFDGQLV